MDKNYNSLESDEFSYALNYQSPAVLSNKKGYTKRMAGTQLPSNFEVFELEQLPVGENHAIGSFYSPITGETYTFHYNSNGVNFITRISQQHGKELVYSGPCLSFSANPKHSIESFRCFFIWDKTCKNKGGKYLHFVDGINEYRIDVEASISTKSFSTPFFNDCNTGCEFVNLCVPDPIFCPKVTLIPLTEQDKLLPNDVFDTAFQFRIQHVYYDGRESVWSKSSQPVYQNTQDKDDFSARGRSYKVRVFAGNPMVDSVRIYVSKNGTNVWAKVAEIKKYKEYNSSQQMWYERGLAPLPGYSITDCSFDYVFYNNTAGETADPKEAARNINPHPRQTQCIIPVNNAIAYCNYIKGSCPIPKHESDKFKVGYDTARINTKRGLKSRGFYKWGFVLHGDCGRFSFVQGVTDMEIPRDQGNATATGFYEFFYDFTGMVLPAWVKSVSIVRTKNQKDFRLQWKVDSVSRVNGFIHIGIQSLNNYNERRYFKTNTKYQWVQGDRVIFISNGNGNRYIEDINVQTVNPFIDKSLPSAPSNPPDDFFNTLVLPVDSRLSGLVAGAVIELERQSLPVDNVPYFELCMTLNVSNGQLVNPKGNFHTWDTFFVKREIDVSFNKVLEHHSINDFWPTTEDARISDTGRVWYVNDYSDEKRYGRNITLNSPNVPNRFGDTEKTMPCPEHGDIIAMSVYDGKVGLAIGQNDNFLYQISDNLLRITSAGTVSAAPADSLISNPEPKLSGVFGCRYEDIGSIYFGDGFVTWVDLLRKTHVRHTFSSGESMSYSKTESYFRWICEKIIDYNKTAVSETDKYRFVSGYNEFDKVGMLTTKRLRDAAVSNQFKPFLDIAGTIMFMPENGEYFGFAAFLPETYAKADLTDGDNGCMFLTYYNSLSYLHPIFSSTCNVFYGIHTDSVMQISCSGEKAKQIKLMSLEQQESKFKWFVYDIETSVQGYSSEIPAAKFEPFLPKGKFNASFLSNKNGIGGLYALNAPKSLPMGYYALLTMVRDNTIQDRYNTIDNAKRETFSEIETILIKFVPVEQTGFTQNV